MPPWTWLYNAGKVTVNGWERHEMKTHDEKYDDSPLKQLAYLEGEIAGWKDIHRDCQRQFDETFFQAARDYLSDYVLYEYVKLRSYVEDSLTKIKNLEKQLLNLNSRCQNESKRTDMVTKGQIKALPSASSSSSTSCSSSASTSSSSCFA